MRQEKWFFFLCAEAALYASFLLLDLFGLVGSFNVLLKYSGVLLCFGYTIGLTRGRDGGLVCAALGFTALADFFLLVLNEAYILGVSCFCIVQALYFIRIRLLLGGQPWRECVVRSLFTVIVIWGIYNLNMLDPLVALTLFYFIQLLINAFQSLRLGRLYWRFSLGLLLFLCCDFCVGLYNLSGFVTVDVFGPLFSFSRIGMWLFYLPSQVFLALSIETG